MCTSNLFEADTQWPWKISFCKYGSEVYCRIWTQRGREGVGLTVISARDSNLQLTWRPKLATNWRQEPSEMLVANYCFNNIVYSSWRPIGELQNYICSWIQTICERWWSRIGRFRQYDGGRVLFHTSVWEQQQRAINIPQILVQWHKCWLLELKEWQSYEV